MKRFYFIFAVFAYALLIADSTCYADFKLTDSIEEFGEKRYVRPREPRLTAGPLIFHPTLRTEVTYDDNILLEPDDGKDDIVFSVLPGMVIEVPIDVHQIAVGYEADIETFVKRDDQNDQNQSAFALIDLNFPSWYINLLDRFSETSGRAGTTFTGRIPRFDHVVNPKIGYRWKRMTFEGSFSHITRNFRRQVDDRLDFQMVDWTGVVYFDLFARLKALLEYKVIQIDYDDDFLRNGTFQQARIGLEGQLRPNLEVKAKIGAQFRDYEEEERNDFNSWVTDILFEYHFRDNIKLDLEFAREPVESTFAGSNFYTEHLVRAGVEYDVIPRVQLYVDAAYFKHDYSERSTIGTKTAYRHDHHIQAETGVRYKFREWWQFELAYNYLRRNSNFSLFDYTNNRVTLSSNIYY